MSVRIQSNYAGTPGGVYPNGMESLFNRMASDGATPTDTQAQELYAIYRAFEESLPGSPGLIAAASGSACRVSGGYINKVYGLFSSANDFTPGNTSATNQWTIDSTSGSSLIVPNPAAGTGVSRGIFRCGTTINGTAGTIGLIAAFTLNNPTTSQTVDIVQFENPATTTSQASLQDGATGDGNTRIGFKSYSPALAGMNFDYRKGLYIANRFFGGLHSTDGVKAMYQDGSCERRDDIATDTYYAGKSMTPAIGNINTSPDFKLRFAAWFNGPVTQSQFKAFGAALAAYLP